MSSFDGKVHFLSRYKAIKEGDNVKTLLEEMAIEPKTTVIFF